MIKAVNMKGYEFGGKGYSFIMEGFGMLDTETDKFVSHDGRIPYVLRSKKLVQSCIEAGWPETFPKRVAHK